MSDVALERHVVYAERESTLPDCLLGHNFDEVGDKTMLAARRSVFSERVVKHPAIALIRFPPETKILAGRLFIVQTSDGNLVKEQRPPIDVIQGEAALSDIVNNTSSTDIIEGPHLLACRWGIMTWGHWLGEIFPRLVVAEACFPGRFRYVVPQDIFNDDAPRNVWNSILESIRSIGISRSRLFQLRYEKNHVFNELYSVTDTYTNAAFHPDVCDLLRARLLYPSPAQHPGSHGQRRIAILRTESPARNITNRNDAVEVLRKYDFEFVEIGRLPFEDQVHLFNSSSFIVGVLPSGLSGLLFAQSKCKVLTLGPMGYPNTFFIPMIQRLSGICYDVRGPLTRIDERSFIFSDFSIDASQLEVGIKLLDSTNLLETA